MERGGVHQVESSSTRRNQEVNRDEPWSSDSRSSYKISYGAAEKLFHHSQTESRAGHEYLGETRQEAELSSYKPSKKISNATQKEMLEIQFLVQRAAETTRTKKTQMSIFDKPMGYL